MQKSLLAPVLHKQLVPSAAQTIWQVPVPATVQCSKVEQKDFVEVLQTQSMSPATQAVLQAPVPAAEQYS